MEEYSLINFSSARVRGEQEILQETGFSPWALDFARCTNPRRFDLFYSPQTENPKADSLRIMVDEQTYIYRAGSLYHLAGERIEVYESSFLKATMNALKEMEKFLVSKTLLRQLERAPFSNIIKKGGNRYSPHQAPERPGWHMNHATMVVNLADLRPLVEGLIFQQMGNAGEVYWNPQIKSKFMEADGVMRFPPPAVVLAHELMHAYDSVRGMLDRRFIQSETMEQTTVAEFRATYIENQMRKDLGGEYRRFYFYQEGSDKDLLDQNDELILVPTPCISWL